MAVYVVGDIHGKDFWKQLLPIFGKEDSVYFTGDFFDEKGRSRKGDPSWEETKKNWEELVQFALANYGRVHFCIGNHDQQYYWDISDKTGDWDKQHNGWIHSQMAENVDLFAYHYVVGDTVISHAGHTEEFGLSERSCDAYSETVNPMTKELRGQTTSIWIRPENLLKNPLKGYNQVVGHSIVPETKVDGAVSIGSFIKQATTADGHTITFVDTAGEDIYVLPEVKSKTVYDKRAIMKRAHELQKSGLNKSTALKRAWKEAKVGN